MSIRQKTGLPKRYAPVPAGSLRAQPGTADAGFQYREGSSRHIRPDFAGLDVAQKTVDCPDSRLQKAGTHSGERGRGGCPSFRGGSRRD